MKILFISITTMLIFAFCCTGIQKNENGADETEMNNSFMKDKINDIFKRDRDSTNSESDSTNIESDSLETSGDSIKF